jgi:hypothetical protein
MAKKGRGGRECPLLWEIRRKKPHILRKGLQIQRSGKVLESAS